MIEEVGKDGDNEGDWKVGDEVFGLLYGGGYAEYVVADKGMIIYKPAEMSWEYAAGVCEVCCLLGIMDMCRDLMVFWFYFRSGSRPSKPSTSLAATPPRRQPAPSSGMRAPQRSR